MKVKKLSAQDLADLKRKPKLNQFWLGYFQHITVELNRLFFSIFRSPVEVKPASLDLFPIKDFLEDNEEGLNQFFKIMPHNKFGLYHFPYDTLGLLLTRMLGGTCAHHIERDLTQIDQSILNIITSRLGQVLQEPMKAQNRNIEFEFIELDEHFLVNQMRQSGDYICIQEFIICFEGQYYSFGIAFMNRFVERFVLL